MKKQSGFTLIELMVVMAIIAILATAGLSAYTGYIKKSRDTKRIEDVRAINTIIQGSLSANGSPPATMTSVVAEANNGEMITDPLGTDAVCLTGATGDTLGACGYVYSFCDGGAGYLITAHFESKSNQEKYTTTGGASPGYHMGSCTTGATAVGDGGGCSNPGDECGDGTIYVTASLRTTANDLGSFNWLDCTFCSGTLNNGCFDNNWNWACPDDAEIPLDHHPAAQACANLGAGWRLPSQNELNDLFQNSNCKSGNGSCDDTGEVVPNFVVTWYWSSTYNNNSNSAWIQYFGDGIQSDLGVNELQTVRCVQSI